jgi:hypothetical protein
VFESMNWGMISYEVPLETFPDTYNKQPLARHVQARPSLMPRYCVSRAPLLDIAPSRG